MEDRLQKSICCRLDYSDEEMKKKNTLRACNREKETGEGIFVFC